MNNLRQLLELFFKQQLGLRTLALRTLNAYQSDLNKLCLFMQQQNRQEWAQLDHRLLSRFWGQQRQAGVQTVSLQRQASALRCFWQNTPELSQLPLEFPKLHKHQRHLPEVPEVDRLQQFFTQQEPSTDPLFIRDLAMLELFYSSGLRLAELASLKMSDMDAQQRLVCVTGKGQRDRIVPFGTKAATALHHWLQIRAALCIENVPEIFISQQGKALGHRAIQKRLSRYSAALGMPVHPHLLRHAFASHLLESSGDLRAVQELLGHQNISTTAIYTHLDFQHLAQVYDHSHPHANRKPDPD